MDGVFIWPFGYILWRKFHMYLICSSNPYRSQLGVLPCKPGINTWVIHPDKFSPLWLTSICCIFPWLFFWMNLKLAWWNDLADKSILDVTTLVVPFSRLFEVDNSTVLTSTAIIRFIRPPVRRGGRATVRPSVFALMTLRCVCKVMSKIRTYMCLTLWTMMSLSITMSWNLFDYHFE